VSNFASLPKIRQTRNSSYLTTGIASSSQHTLPTQLNSPSQLIKPSQSTMLQRKYEVTVDPDKKCNFEIMFDKYKQDAKKGTQNNYL
jgi:hypothetical protein